jgi:hypothetical protein
MFGKPPSHREAARWPAARAARYVPVVRSILLPAAALAVLVAAGGSAAAAPPAQRACTPAEIASGDAPAFVTARASSYDSGSPALRRIAARRPYAIVVDPYRFESARSANYVESGSVTVTPPPGLDLSAFRRSEDVTAATFTAPARATTLAFRLGYVIQLLDGAAEDSCRADVAFPVPVDAGLPLKGTATVRTPADDNTRFFLHLKPQKPVDPRPVTIALRLAENTATPPEPHGKPLRSYTVHPLRHPLPKGGYINGKRIIFAVSGGPNGSFDVEVSPSIFRGSSIRFGFSVEVRQGGKAIAGMRSGVICKDRLFHRSDGVTRHRATCRHPGFAAKP